MKKAIGIGLALCIMMSLVVILAGAGEGGEAKVRVVQWKGTGTDVLNDELPNDGLPGHLADLVSECDAPIHIFEVDMFDPTTGMLIGTGYDYVTAMDMDEGVANTCYIFDFSRSGHGHGAIISENELTIQPACDSSTLNSGLTHILGDFSDEDTIIDGTGKFKNVEGRVRVSGGVNLTNAPTSIEFDHLFVITLTK